MLNKLRKEQAMSAPPTTSFVSRGRLNGIVREPAARRSGGAPGLRGAGRGPGSTDDLDTQAYGAIYYRARLILGDSLPRPARLERKAA
jgi:hypothetical protein